MDGQTELVQRGDEKRREGTVSFSYESRDQIVTLKALPVFRPAQLSPTQGVSEIEKALRETLTKLEKSPVLQNSHALAKL